MRRSIHDTSARRGRRYLASPDFIAQHGGRAGAMAAMLRWRTPAWSDRSVAQAILWVQAIGHRGPRDERAVKRASLERLSHFLGYKCRTPLVARAINRLMLGGWIRPTGPSGRGRRRVYEFWAGPGRPDEAAVAAAAVRIEWPRIMRSKPYRQLYASAVAQALGEDDHGPTATASRRP